MRYCNSLMVLRLTTVLLAVLVAKDYDIVPDILRILLRSLLAVLNSESALARNRTSRSWDDVDIFVPPKLNDRAAEALRLNELLARKQYKCEDSVKIDDDKGGFIICNDGKLNHTIGEALFISGSPDDYVSFLISVMPERWTFFVPEGFQILEKLGNVDAEMHYLFELRDNGVWSADEILYELSNRRFDTALISVYSPYVGGHSKQARMEELRDAPKLTEKILRVLISQQLQLNIEIDAKTADEVLYAWYSLLYQMLFKYNYALIGAESAALCHRTVHSCRYLLSFIRMGYDKAELPVFGFGSPLEERKRLVKYLAEIKHTSINCDKVEYNENDVPLLCKLETNANACTVVYVRYREFKTAENFEQFRPCEVHFFSPIEANLKIVSTRNTYPYGISPHRFKNLTVPGSSENKSWLLITLADMLDMINSQKVDKLILDLDGGEWDVFPALLEGTVLKVSVLDLDMRVRLWIGEENENFRRFLMYFLRLEELGFKKLFSRIYNKTTVLVNYRNKKAA